MTTTSLTSAAWVELVAPVAEPTDVLVTLESTLPARLEIAGSAPGAGTTNGLTLTKERVPNLTVRLDAGEGLYGTALNTFSRVTTETSGVPTPDGVSETGWAEYVDTQYTEGSPFQIVADTKVSLPNNAGTIRDSQKPTDVASFYTGGLITGRNGDGLIITVEFKAKPTSVGSTYMEVSLDIGGAVGEIYPRPITFPKGNGEERPVNFSTAGFTLDTFEANGGALKVVGNGPFDIYGIRYVLTRSHKAR